jgi:hypothetical protein
MRGVSSIRKHLIHHIQAADVPATGGQIHTSGYRKTNEALTDRDHTAQ